MEDKLADIVNDRFKLINLEGKKTPSVSAYYGKMARKSTKIVRPTGITLPTTAVLDSTPITFEWECSKDWWMNPAETHFLATMILTRGNTNNPLQSTDLICFAQLPIACLFKSVVHEMNDEQISNHLWLPQTEAWQRRTQRSPAYNDSIPGAEGWVPCDTTTRQAINGLAKRDFVWFPKFGIFNSTENIPAAKHSLTFEPVPGFKGIINTSTGATDLVWGTDYKLIIQSLVLRVALEQGVTPSGAKAITFKDTNMSPNVVPGTAGSAGAPSIPFKNIPRSVVALGVFFQSQDAGRKTTQSMTHFTSGVVATRDLSKVIVVPTWSTSVTVAAGTSANTEPLVGHHDGTVPAGIAAGAAYPLTVTMAQTIIGALQAGTGVALGTPAGGGTGYINTLANLSPPSYSPVGSGAAASTDLDATYALDGFYIGLGDDQYPSPPLVTTDLGTTSGTAAPYRTDLQMQLYISTVIGSAGLYDAAGMENVGSWNGQGRYFRTAVVRPSNDIDTEASVNLSFTAIPANCYCFLVYEAMRQVSWTITNGKAEGGAISRWL